MTDPASSEPTTPSQPSAEATPAAAAPPAGPAPLAGAMRRAGGKKVAIGSQRPGTRKVQAKAQEEFSQQARPQKTTPVPNIRQGLEPDEEIEFVQALGDVSLDEMLDPATAAAATSELAADTRCTARVVMVHGDDVFVDLGNQHQGVLSARQFVDPPKPGQVLQVVVQRFLPDDGLYQVGPLGSSAVVEDWTQISEGILVDALVTGHNKGGLECQVSRIRGFIPASQIAPYRVEDFAQYVGQTLPCVVTEADAERRKLVLSHRAVLERQKEEAKTALMGQLAEGQVREGVVRSLQDFGAFVDLGGVDGLLHVSQLSWQRVKHPNEVLSIGQRVKVLIRKIDHATGRLSLAMRDLVENPWHTLQHRHPVTSIVRGRVTRIMDFGAFVEVEPGVEGLVHISELSVGRVFRVRDIVEEGQEIEVKILSIDPDEQRMSLSLKAVQMLTAQGTEAEESAPADPNAPPPPPRPEPKNLKGGLKRDSGGERFGLKW